MRVVSEVAVKGGYASEGSGKKDYSGILKVCSLSHTGTMDRTLLSYRPGA